MKSFARVLLLIALLVVWPSLTHAEDISSFAADITIHRDSSVRVVETIQYDFGAAHRHGIFRYIPTSHSLPARVWYKEHYVDIAVEKVTRDGHTEPFTERQQSGQVYLKIGDPDQLITGAHTYTITYNLKGALSFPATGTPEFYWNVTGNDWPVAMRSVRVLLHDPDQVFTAQHACYQGRAGSTTRCSATSTNDGTVFTASSLAAAEGVTIAQAVDSQKVTPVVLERIPPVWLWGVVLVVWLLGLLGFIVYQKTRYRTHRSIIAQYEPYPGVKPMYTGFLMDGRLDGRDITAGIVYLAQQGFLKIKKVERKALFLFSVDDYEVTLLRSKEEIESSFLQRVLELLFRGQVAAGATVTLHELAQDRKTKQYNFATLTKLKSALEKDLVQQGFFAKSPLLLWIAANRAQSGVVLIAALVFMFGIGVVAADQTVLVLVAILVIITIFVAAMLRIRTRRGYEALDYLKGFKLFLEATDKERFDFHNAPEKSPEQFMEYLPYAIAFGVEKKWAKVFEGITIPNPDWYDGGTTGATFSTISLTESVGAFSSSFTGSAGISASSGGGVSGGGAGGGGGGSW